MNDMSLKDAQQKVDEWIKRHGVRYFNELTNMALLTEEVGEVARIISRKFGEQSFKEGEDGSRLGEELADVLFVLICIANQTEVNLTEELKKSLAKKTSRDSSRHKNNGKLK
jgi:NTP pyrophosphatase (non-canonical NTP hydrolase)